MAQATGIVSVVLDDPIGLLDTLPDSEEIEPGGYIKERVETNHGVHYREKRVACMIKVKVVHTSDTLMKALQSYKGTMKYKTDSGKTMVSGSAFHEGLVKLSGGELELTFAGEPADEQ